MSIWVLNNLFGELKSTYETSNHSKCTGCSMRSYTSLSSVFPWLSLPFYSPCSMMKIVNDRTLLKSVFEVFRLTHFASVVIVAARKLKIQGSDVPPLARGNIWISVCYWIGESSYSEGKSMKTIYCFYCLLLRICTWCTGYFPTTLILLCVIMICQDIVMIPHMRCLT